MKRNFLMVFVMLLSFSYILYVSAIPATRTKNLIVEDESVFPYLPQDHGSLKLENGEEMVHMDEFRSMGRRIDLGLHDYAGPGENTEHDPKTPGHG